MVQKEKYKKYTACIVAMILLLLIAAFGPQLLFMIQDRHVQGDVFTGERDRMDLTVLNAGYTKVLRERLTNYAEGLQEERQYYTTVTEYEKDAECYSILENVLDREWLTFLNDIGLTYFIYDSVQTGYTVEEWKRYVIYDAELENGVAIMAWYFLITLNDNVQMQLLVDVEDDTVYQVQILMTDEKYYDLDSFGIPYEDILTVVPLYWFYYYDAGDVTGEWDSVEYDMYSEKNEKYKNYMMQNGFTSYNSAGDTGISMEENAVELRKELLYEEYFLQWKLRIEHEQGTQHGRISMGISDIAEIIPEFLAN